MARDGGRAITVERWDTSVSYKEAAQRQEELVSLRRETLILCEHPPVITLGTSANADDLLFPREYYERLNIAVVNTLRGGQVTYHGPGQLVVYPILDLRERGFTVHTYLRFLEDLTIRFCSEYEVTARRIEGKTGGWVDDRKIAFIGVRVRKGFSFHGLSVNITPQREPFGSIVPCGIRDLSVTSLHEETGDTSLDLWDTAVRIEKLFFEEIGFSFSAPTGLK